MLCFIHAGLEDDILLAHRGHDKRHADKDAMTWQHVYETFT